MAYEDSDMGVALGWDDEIDVVESEFEPVPDGEYGFEVVSVERAHFNGSAKMGPCPVAKVQVRLTDDGRGAHLFERFMLNSKMSWKIAQFFVSVGLRPADAGKDEKLKMDWTRSIGLSGRCRVGSHEHNGKTYNDVDEWLKPAAPAAYVPPAAAVPAPAGVQQAVNQAFAQAPQAAQMTPGAF